MNPSTRTESMTPGAFRPVLNRVLNTTLQRMLLRLGPDSLLHRLANCVRSRSLRRPVKRQVAALAFLMAVLPGCASIDPATYQAEKPVLSLNQFFNGTLSGWGMFQDRSGKVLRRFTVTIKASWQGDTGTLDEDFIWSDGERQKRVWTLRRQADGSYTGTASDVVGQALGQVAGNALHWTYTMEIPIGGRNWHFTFDDWMFLIDEKVLLNRATMSKFGIRAGEVTLTLIRQ